MDNYGLRINKKALNNRALRTSVYTDVDVFPGEEDLKLLPLHPQCCVLIA
jgi:hypothetical protein